MIRDIEGGKKALSDKLASRIAFYTGVSLDWLLANDVKRPAVDGAGQLYTRQVFRDRQRTPGSSDPFSTLRELHSIFLGGVASLATLVACAHRNGQLRQFVYELYRALEKLSAAAGSEALTELVRLWERIPPSGIVEREQLMEEIDRFLRMTQLVFQRQLCQPTAMGKAIAEPAKRSALSKNRNRGVLRGHHDGTRLCLGVPVPVDKRHSGRRT